MIVMKKILNSIIATIFAITLSGCWGLDYYPSNAIGEDNFLDRASDVDKLMNSTYAQIKNAWAFGYDFLFDSVTDIATGDYFQNYAMGISAYSDGWFQNCWQQTYNVVQRANTTIRLLSEAQTGTGAGEITTAMVNQGIAEAKFLRALGYFRLISLYGDIPYYDETTVLSESFGDMYVDISPIASVREKIINDLNEAEKVLPSSWETTKYGRATKWAAIALRGKVRLYAKEYAAAAADFDNVINNGIAYGSTKLALDPDYAHVFKTWGTGNRCPEMIFSIQNSNESGSATTSLMGNKSSLRQIPTDRMNPSPKLIDMYEKKDGTPFNWDEYLPGWNSGNMEKRRDLSSVTIDLKDGIAYVNDMLQADTSAMARAYRERDPRLMVTAITPYSKYLGTTAGSNPQWFNYYLVNTTKSAFGPNEGNGCLRNNNGGFTPSYLVRKFVIEGNLGGEYSNAPFEWPIIRLADVMLMAAECYNETGNDAKACEYVNLVRARVNMPAIQKSGNELRDYIRDERARELPFEGHRFFDIRRWGIGPQVVTGDATTIWGSRIYTMSYPAKHDVWPIPMVELDRTPGWKGSQKQGW